MKVKVLSLTRVVVSASILILLLWGKSVDGLKVKRLNAGSLLSSKSNSKEKLAETLTSQVPPVEETCSKTNCPGGIPSKTPGAKSSLHSSDSKPIKSDGKKEEETDVKSLKPVGSDDEPSFEAISFLHRQLDDDANGNIDISESDEFLRDELQYENAGERQKTFHGNDKHISVDELWRAWKTSEVHNWTTEQTIQWLVQNVELPQYAQVFQDLNVNGSHLPRMAVPNMQYLTQVLGVKDHRHKQKLALKSMDVVLFGPPRHHNYVKDSLLVLLLVIAIGGCWFAYVQHKHSQNHMKKMMKDMESLQHAEEALEVLAKELDKAREENLQRKIKERESSIMRRESSRAREAAVNGDVTGVSSGGSSPEEEISKRLELEDELRRTKEQLARMEQDFEARSWSPPQALQHWLQLTYELEQKHYNAKKANAEQQLAAAKEGCEKIRKRRSSFLGTFRIAHGGVIDDVDNWILQARAALSEVTKDLQERLQRWRQIELLCGFPIVMNPGAAKLEAILRGTTVANGSTSTLGHFSARSNMSRSCSEGTLLDEETLAAQQQQVPPPIQPYGGTSAGSVITMPGYVNAHLPSPGVVSELRREHVQMGRLGSSNSLSSESKSQPGPAVSGSQLSQLDEEVATDDEVDNGELDDNEEAAKGATVLLPPTTQSPLATTNGGRASSAPPEDRAATFIVGGGDSPQIVSSTSVRGRVISPNTVVVTAAASVASVAPHHSPYYQQSSSSSSSSTNLVLGRPPSWPDTSLINPSNQLARTDSTDSWETPAPAAVVKGIGQLSPSGSVSSSGGGGSVSGRRKKGNLMSSLRQGLPSNPPPTLEEENSTDSASVDESDSRKEKKKMSIFSRLKKKKTT